MIIFSLLQGVGGKPEEVEFNLDQLMAHIRSLPPVPLQEPDSFQIAHLCAAPGAGLPSCKLGLILWSFIGNRLFKA